ncbi:MAG: hypothetical protein R2847_00755 [Bacteroidia bacterium]
MPVQTVLWGETEDYQITILALNSCTGTPSASSTTSSVTSVCPNTSFDLSLSPTYTESDLVYQWQSSTDGGITWINFGSNVPVISTTITAIPCTSVLSPVPTVV